jgi:hypothetical protein
MVGRTYSSGLLLQSQRALLPKIQSLLPIDQVGKWQWNACVACCCYGTYLWMPTVLETVDGMSVCLGGSLAFGTTADSYSSTRVLAS